MIKTDILLHKICIRSIERSLFKSAELNFTFIYKNIDDDFALKINYNHAEIRICSTIIDNNNWSLLTTQRLITSINNTIYEVDIEKATNRMYGDFKGLKSESYTFGKVGTQDNKEVLYFIEIGKASMVMVQGVKTRIQIQNLSPE